MLRYKKIPNISCIAEKKDKSVMVVRFIKIFNYAYKLNVYDLSQTMFIEDDKS